MITIEEAKDLINDLFEEEALVIGGLVALHKIDDDLVWRLMKNFDVIRGKALHRIDDSTSKREGVEGKPNLKPHPAIEDFLLNLRRK